MNIPYHHGISLNAAMEMMFFECFNMTWENAYTLMLTVRERGLSMA